MKKVVAAVAIVLMTMPIIGQDSGLYRHKQPDDCNYVTTCERHYELSFVGYNVPVLTWYDVCTTELVCN